MGIFEWIKSQTGTWGPALLDLYFQNAGWINAIVVTYGFLLILSWLNLARVQDALAEQIFDQAGRMKDTKTSDKKKVIHIKDFELSWEKALAASNFPFFARQSGLLIRHSTQENARVLITDKDLVQRCARRLNEMGLQLEKSN